MDASKIAEPRRELSGLNSYRQVDSSGLTSIRIDAAEVINYDPHAACYQAGPAVLNQLPHRGNVIPRIT